MIPMNVRDLGWMKARTYQGTSVKTRVYGAVSANHFSFPLAISVVRPRIGA